MAITPRRLITSGLLHTSAGRSMSFCAYSSIFSNMSAANAASMLSPPEDMYLTLPLFSSRAAPGMKPSVNILMPSKRSPMRSNTVSAIAPAPVCTGGSGSGSRPSRTSLSRKAMKCRAMASISGEGAATFHIGPVSKGVSDITTPFTLSGSTL